MNLSRQDNPCKLSVICIYTKRERDNAQGLKIVQKNERLPEKGGFEGNREFLRTIFQKRAAFLKAEEGLREWPTVGRGG